MGSLLCAFGLGINKLWRLFLNYFSVDADCLLTRSGAGSSSDSSLPGEVKQEPSNGHSDKSHIECVVSTLFNHQPLYSIISSFVILVVSS